MNSSVAVPLLGVLLAVVVSFVANFIYFGPKTMFPIWWRAIGKSPEDQPGDTGQSPAMMFGPVVVASIVQALLMSWVLQAVAKLYNTADVSLVTGTLVGLAIGIGFAAAPALGHRLFSGQGFKVWLIESGGDILGLTLMGAVLSFFV
jgi:hypothetical protein